MLQNWKSWCRLCSDCYQSDVDLFYQFESITNIFMLIEKHFDISITKDDGMPQTICEDCFSFIIRLNRFSNKCKQVDSMYGELFHKQFDKDTSKHELLKIRKEFKLDNVLPMENVFVESTAIEMISDDEDKLDDNQNHFIEPNTEEINVQNEKVVEENLEKNDSSDKAIAIPNESSFSLTLSCKLCNKKFKNKNELKKHDSIEHIRKNNYYLCSKCPKRYIKKNELEKHNLNHHRKMHCCSICNKKYRTRKCLSVHQKIAHKDRNSYICDICGSKFDQIASFASHKFIHTDEKLISCPQCPMKFKDEESLKVHNEWHEDKNYKCELCESTFNTAQCLKIHMHKHSDTKPFKCNVCNNSFKTSKTLKIHAVTHTGIKPYKCPFCVEVFLFEANCRSHVIKHHPTDAAKYKEEGKTTKVVLIDKNDLIQKNEKEKPKKKPKANHICRICSATFTTSQHLYRHTLNHNDKRYKCELCGNSFKRLSFLKMHLVSHTGIKPYQCAFCDRVFSFKSTCSKHAYTVHPFQAAQAKEDNKSTIKTIAKLDELIPKQKISYDVNIHVCDICEASFKSDHLLKRHMIIHSDKNTYKCDLCNIGFKGPHPLKVHMIRHTGVKPYKCPFCDEVFSFTSSCNVHARKMHPKEVAKYKKEGKTIRVLLHDVNKLLEKE